MNQNFPGHAIWYGNVSLYNYNMSKNYQNRYRRFFFEKINKNQEIGKNRILSLLVIFVWPQIHNGQSK